MKHIHLILLAILSVLLAFSASAAEETLSVQIHHYDSEPFSDQVAKRVDVYLSVTDQDGNPVTGLDKDSFSLTESTVLQEVISVDQNVDDPLSMVFMLDNSQSIGGYLPDIVRYAGSFLEELGPMDETAVMQFNETSNLMQGFTVNHSMAASKLSEISGEQRTGSCIYDTAYESLTLLAEKEPGRRVLVIFTDGKDERYADLETCSGHTKEDIEKFAGDEDIPVYIIGFGNRIDRPVLSSLAGNTGGSFISAPNLSDVEGSFQKLGAQLRNEYRLSYISIGSGMGQYILIEAKNGDASGRASKHVTLKETPLIMSFRTPAEGEELKGTAELSVEFLLLNEKIASVKYYYKGELIGESIAYPYVYNWDLSHVEPAQDAVLEAVCVDKNGGELARASVSVSLAEVPVPEIVFTVPEQEEPYRGSVALSAEVTGTDSGISRVEYFADGKYLDRAVEPPFAYTWDISQYETGENEIMAVAYAKDNSEIARGTRTFRIEAVPAAKSGPNLPLLIGIVCGVLLIGAAAFVILRRKEKKESPASGTVEPAHTPEEIASTTFVRLAPQETDGEPGPAIILEITSCEDETMTGKQFYANRLPVTIGRSPDNDIRLSAKEVSVSRYHAQIEERDGVIVIQDAGSKYGTFVNNKNIRNEPCKLKNDDVIKLGRSVRIKYRNSAMKDDQDGIEETAVGFHLAGATLMADTERSKIVK